jgi:4-amino-4-deoxy-L-arabinose transferase-like glycosyltransferase
MKKIISSLVPYFPIVSILMLGAYLRLYKISLYMTFLGDEGRDALIVKRMIVDGKWTLLGPTASVGGFFMGPIYYYFMAPFLWLWNFNPVGPAIMVALFGIATIYLVYYVGKRIFGAEVGIIASGLYALSPLVISYSRSSWNPNIVPFFGILLFFFLWDVVANHHWKRLFWIGIIFGIGLQLHYTFLSLFGVIFIWFLLYGRKRSYVKHYFLGIVGFLVGFSPFLAFEIRHGFMNIRSIVLFVFEGKDTGFSILHFVSNITDVYFRLFGRLILRIPEKGVLGNFPFIEKTLLIDGTWILAFSALILCLGIFVWKKQCVRLFLLEGKRKDEFYYGCKLLILWVLVILSFFGFYKKAMYDYYSGMMYFVPFIIVGLFYAVLYHKGFWWKFLGLGIVGALMFYNWQGRPFRYTPNNQLGQVELIAREIIAKTDGKPFNFALITGGNSDHAYRYFFELWGKSPVTIENAVLDPMRKTVTDQLLIVCEDISCQPLGNSLWEVAGFGRGEIAKEWDVSVVKLYKLIHYKGEKTSL